MQQSFWLDELPPSANHAWARAKWGGRIKTAKYREFEEYVSEVVGLITLDPGPLSVEMDVHRPDWFTQKGTARRVDLDNYIKCCLDALFKALDLDDKWIFHLHVKKAMTEKTGVAITIYDLSEQ